MKTGLVLEGGGTRGIYTAGVLDVFIDYGLHFDGVMGVSAGAIHGCSYLSHQKGRSIRYYMKYCNDPRFMSIKSWLKTGDIVGEKFCYYDIPKELDPYDYETFSKNTSEFYVGCTNVETGKPEYLRITDMDKQIDGLRASASLPYFSKIVTFEGKKLLDGGCSDSIPVAAFQKMGFERNVVILTRHESYRKKPEARFLSSLCYRKYPAFVDTLNNRHAEYNETLKQIHNMEKEGSIFVIRPSQVPDIGRMEKNPEKVKEIYDMGHADAQKAIHQLMDWLKQI